MSTNSFFRSPFSVFLIISSFAFLVFIGSCESLTGSGENNNSGGAGGDHPFAGGSGTEDDPYQVETLTQLDSVRHYLGVHFIQTADIDASETGEWNDGAGFSPIGTSESSFRGSYNGNGKTITGLHISPSYQETVGMFGFIQGAVLENMTVEDVEVEVSGSGKVFSGGLVGKNSNSEIINCRVTGSLSGGSTISNGGLVGTNQGIISSSVANVTVTSDTLYSGGLAGRNVYPVNGNWDVKIEESIARGTVKGGKVIGGAVGINGANLINVTAEGDVEGRQDIGGLIGINDEGTTRNSTAKGKVTGPRGAGGFVGANWEGTIRNSSAEGNVQGGKTAGGFAGITSGKIESSSASGMVEGTDWVGGFAGTADGSITGSEASGDVTGNNRKVGGFAGSVRADAFIKQSTTEGDVSGNIEVGGFAGVNEGEITTSFSSGTVQGYSDVGGIVGLGEAGSVVSECYSTSAVNGKYGVIGGIIGENRQGAEVVNSYSVGDVNGDNNTGGIAGENQGHISKSFAAGTVSISPDPHPRVGGIAGTNYSQDGQAVISQSYWDQDATDQTDGVGYNGLHDDREFNGGTGLSTSQMTGSSAEDNLSELDFENVWVVTEDYPALQWQEE